jgi:hypothetical protein
MRLQRSIASAGMAFEIYFKTYFMKKIIPYFLIGVFNFSFLQINAQHAIGIKAGVNIASLSEFTGRSRISGHGGLFLHHTINKNWCIQPELLYSGEGQRYFSDGVEHTLALDYLQFPVMIQYYPVPNIYLEAGPQFGVLLSARDKVEGIDESHINIKEDFSSGQIALGVGAGLKVTEQIILYGRYNFGLTDVTRFDNIVDKSNVGQLGVALRFHR